MCVHFSFNITNHSLQIWECFSILESIIRCFLLCILSTIHNWGKLYTGWRLLMRLWFGANLCEVNGCATGKKKKENHIDILMYSSKPHTWMDLFPHHSVQFSSVAQSYVWLFATPWTATQQASLSITNSRSPLKPMSIELVMPSNHFILCHPLLLLPSIFPRSRVFSNESTLRIRWPSIGVFSFSISPSYEYSGLISFRMDWLDLFAVQGTLKSLLQHRSSKDQFFSTQLSL